MPVSREPEVLQITERAGEGMAVAALRGPRRGVTHRAAEEGVGGRDAQGQRILTTSSALVVLLQVTDEIRTSRRCFQCMDSILYRDRQEGGAVC